MQTAMENASMDNGLTNRKKRFTATIPEASELLGIHVKTAFAQAASSSLPVPVFRSGRRVLVSRHHLEALLGDEAVALVLDRDAEPEPAVAS